MSSVPYPNPQAMFYQQYEAVRRDEVVGILLALFLGTFGIHHFYLHRTGLGILYCCFCWTGIPTLLGFIECFFMAGRVREYNAMQAAGIAAIAGDSGAALESGLETRLGTRLAPRIIRRSSRRARLRPWDSFRQQVSFRPQASFPGRFQWRRKRYARIAKE